MLLADLVDLVLPASCAGCDGWSTGPLCDLCRAALATVDPQRTRPRPLPPGLPSTYALAAYGGVLRSALLQYKEHNRHEVAPALGALLATVVDRALRNRPGPALLLPVPATPAAVRRRHGDHIVRLADHAVRALRRGGVPAAVAQPLRALPKSGDSAELSAADRAVAAQDAFAVRPRRLPEVHAALAAGAVVVLVDDIVTTGVTLAAATGQLAAAGLPVHCAVTLAATRRRHSPSPLDAASRCSQPTPRRNLHGT